MYVCVRIRFSRCVGGTGPAEKAGSHPSWSGGPWRCRWWRCSSCFLSGSRRRRRKNCTRCTPPRFPARTRRWGRRTLWRQTSVCWLFWLLWCLRRRACGGIPHLLPLRLHHSESPLRAVCVSGNTFECWWTTRCLLLKYLRAARSQKRGTRVKYWRLAVAGSRTKVVCSCTCGCTRYTPEWNCCWRWGARWPVGSSPPRREGWRAGSASASPRSLCGAATGWPRFSLESSGKWCWWRRRCIRRTRGRSTCKAARGWEDSHDGTRWPRRWRCPGTKWGEYWSPSGRSQCRQRRGPPGRPPSCLLWPETLSEREITHWPQIYISIFISNVIKRCIWGRALIFSLRNRHSGAHIYLSGIPEAFGIASFAQRRSGWSHSQPRWQRPGWPWTPHSRSGWETRSSSGCREEPATGPKRPERLLSGSAGSPAFAAERRCPCRHWR